MTPAARVSAAIDLLDTWLGGGERMERLLRAWGRANRYAGSKDRRAIADIVYDGIRKQRSLSWQSGATGGRGILHGMALSEGWLIEEIFSGARFAPSPLTEGERFPERGHPPDPVAFDHPDWLEAPLKDALGSVYPDVMIAMAHRAPVDLRVNRIKTTPEAALARLCAEGIKAAFMPNAPEAIRCPPGTRVASSGAYLEGWVELQDIASQRAAAFALEDGCRSILDFCAGGGGKSLAFASLTHGAARIVAHDVAPERMKDLPERSSRAGAGIHIARTSDRIEGPFDLVFVDAPCSGSGVWRRDPEAKWHLSPQRLKALAKAQEDAFVSALQHVKPGGKIAYATCSLLREENTDMTELFAQKYQVQSTAPPFRVQPGEADGFFCNLFTVSK